MLTALGVILAVLLLVFWVVKGQDPDPRRARHGKRRTLR
jgi:hypothetical protein